MTRVLDVKWHSQRNNKLYPYGTCNATSIATVMQWLNVQPSDWGKENEQLDDYVTRQLDTPDAHREHQRTLSDWRNWNPRNNHYVLQWYMEQTMPIKDELIISNIPAYFDKIKDSINNNIPVICGGSYTRKKISGKIDTIGHINVIVGYTDTGFIFCDPFGNALSLYQDNNGDHIEYPYDFCQKALSLLHLLKKDPSIIKDSDTAPNNVVYKSNWTPPPPAPVEEKAGKQGVAAIPASKDVYYLAEGDSWFDYGYLGGYDIVSWVKKKIHNQGIETVSKMGDTIDHMLGEGNIDFLNRKLTNVDKQFPETYKIVLFSGGGNDVIGDGLEKYLSVEPAKRAAYLDNMINTDFYGKYKKMIDTMLNYKYTYVITHGYGYAVPSGIGHFWQKGDMYSMNWFGPWILPTLQRHGINDKKEQRQIINNIVDTYNAMLDNLMKEYDKQDNYRGRFIHIDLRKQIEDSFWQNELHLSTGGYSVVADRFVEKINMIKSGNA